MTWVVPLHLDPSHPAAMGRVRQFLHKMTPQRLREKGATIHDSSEVCGLLLWCMFVVAITLAFEAGNNVMEIVNYSMNVPWHIPQVMPDSHTTELIVGGRITLFVFLARLASYMPLEDQVGS